MKTLTRALGTTFSVSPATDPVIQTILESKSIKGKYTRVYFNVRTFIRNFYNSVEDAYEADFRQFVKELIEEMETIHHLIKNSGAVKNGVYWYYPTYETLYKASKHAKLKLPSTKLQKQYEEREIRILEEMLRRDKEGVINKVDSVVNGNNSRSIIVTHYPSDLLSVGRFKELVMVESHTGLLKKESEWNTKIGSFHKNPNIPFNLLSIQVFGDGSKQFRANSRILGETLLELADKRNWHPGIGLMKVKYDINTIKDKAVKEIFQEMLSLSLK